MKSFSFIEVIISVVIGAISFLAIFSLASQNLNAAQLTRQRFVAANLAQEGIEIVANIRSKNWLIFPDDLNPDGTLKKWREGLNDNPSTPYIAQYNSTALTLDSDISHRRLNIDSSGLYCHSSLSGCTGSTALTPYSRTITISTVNDHQMKVLASVSWKYNNKDYSVVVEERLYNWK